VLSRAGFYRSLLEREPVEEDMEVRSAIQQIFAEHKRRYGYIDALIVNVLHALNGVELQAARSVGLCSSAEC
jgi:hypothetical protein